MAEKAAPKCPSCGGTKDIRVMKYQGERYYQCWCPVQKYDRLQPCKFWSTKWAVGEG